MKTILHILNTSEYSGAENVAMNIIKHYNLNYHGIYMSPDGNIRRKIEGTEIEYYGVKKLSITTVKRAVRDMHPDIIHAHDFTASVLAVLATKEIPIISHLHTNAPWMKRVSLKSIIYRLCIPQIKKIATVSDSVIRESWYSSLIEKKGVCIGNPIDLASIWDKKESNIPSNLLFVGRLEEPKNPLEFLWIIKELKEKNIQVVAKMLGKGKLEKQCHTFIKKNHLEDCVTIHGFVENPYDYMTEGTILVVPSKWEGFGLVAIEAFAFGVPVIANPVGGLPQIVTENSGLLSSERDKKMEEIIKLLNNRDYYKRKSIAARIQAEKSENISSYMENIYLLYK